jgi:hypothetical protein
VIFPANVPSYAYSLSPPPSPPPPVELSPDEPAESVVAEREPAHGFLT